MSRILVPSSGPDDWQRFLAKPELHWATGFSARTLAHCWEAANPLPTEVEIVHSFSAEGRWFGDFAEFVALLGVDQDVEPGRAVTVTVPSGRPLMLGWATGAQKFREA